MSGAGGKKLDLLLNQNSHTALTVAIAQIAGTFLGLYFTAISLVLSTKYADAPDELRELIAEEKIGNSYIRLVAILAVYSLFLLFVQTCGFNWGALPLLPLFVMSTGVVLNFVPLGMRTFRFFEPTALASHLTLDFRESVRGASPKGFRWSDASYQDYYRRRVKRVILLWEQVAQQTRHRPTSSADDVATIGAVILDWLSFYASYKNSIPANSKWFEERYSSKDWLWASSTELGMALNTNTPLQPNTEPDAMWIERKLVQLLVDVLEYLIRQEEWLLVAQTCSHIAQVSSLLGSRFAIEEGQLLLKETRRVLYPACKKRPFWPATARAIYKIESEKTSSAAEQPMQEEKFLALITALDSLGLAYIQLFLGLLHQAPEAEGERIKDFLARGNWRRPLTFYPRNLPRLAWDEWTRLEKEISFQLSVENQVLSPLWQQKQYLARGFLRFWVEAIEMLIADLKPFYLDPLLVWKQAGCLPQAAHCAVRGLEATHKIEAHLHGIQEMIAHLHSMRCVDDGLWRLPDWKALSAELASVRSEIVYEFSRLGTLFLSEERHKSLPDYGGHAFSLLSNEVVGALETGNEKEFARLFPLLKVGALSAFDRVNREYNEKDYPLLWQEARWANAAEPLKNLLAVSGLALLWSELEGKNFWTFVEQQWNAMLDERADPDYQPDSADAEGLCKLLALAADHGAFGPKGAWNILRYNWHRSLEQKLEAAGFSDRFYNPVTRRMPPPPAHPSPLIRCHTQHGGELFMGTSPEDYFLVHFLSHRPEAANIRWSHQVENLQESWERFQAWEQEKSARDSSTDGAQEEDDEI